MTPHARKPRSLPRRLAALTVMFAVTAACTRRAEPADDQAATAPAPGETRTETVGDLTLEVPVEWTRESPKSPMRVAQFTLPGPGGDTELVVFRFPGGAGGVAANLERWKGQFQDEHGAPVAASDQTVDTIQRDALTLTRADIRGTYVAAVRPGANERHNMPNARMIALIVEGAGDPYFFKVVGARATVDRWEGALGKLVETIKAP